MLKVLSLMKEFHSSYFFQKSNTYSKNPKKLASLSQTALGVAYSPKGNV